MIFMILDLIFQLSPASPFFLWSTGNGFDHSTREVPETYLELQELAEILRIKSGHVYYDFTEYERNPTCLGEVMVRKLLKILL